jgi:hypothetical protein
MYQILLGSSGPRIRDSTASTAPMKTARGLDRKGRGGRWGEGRTHLTAMHDFGASEATAGAFAPIGGRHNLVERVRRRRRYHRRRRRQWFSVAAPPFLVWCSPRRKTEPTPPFSRSPRRKTVPDDACNRPPRRPQDRTTPARAVPDDLHDASPTPARPNDLHDASPARAVPDDARKTERRLQPTSTTTSSLQWALDVVDMKSRRRCRRTFSIKDYCDPWQKNIYVVSIENQF